MNLKCHPVAHQRPCHHIMELCAALDFLETGVGVLVPTSVGLLDERRFWGC